MMNKSIIDKLINNPRVKNLGLKEEIIVYILDNYYDLLFDDLLKNGRTTVGSGIVIDVVPLLDRVHRLRGVAYQNNRKFKLKLTLDDISYKKIEEYYNKLKEDIL